MLNALMKSSQQQKGFTLVEVLVALAVLAIALPALMLSISEQIRGLEYLREKSIAHWVAMNKMTELRLQNTHKEYLPKDRKNGSTEMLGREWFWVIDTEKTSEELLLQVTINVRATRNDDEAALASVVNFFLLPQARNVGANSSPGGNNGENGREANPLPGDEGANAN